MNHVESLLSTEEVRSPVLKNPPSFRRSRRSTPDALYSWRVGSRKVAAEHADCELLRMLGRRRIWPAEGSQEHLGRLQTSGISRLMTAQQPIVANADGQCARSTATCRRARCVYRSILLWRGNIVTFGWWLNPAFWNAGPSVA